MRGHLGFVIVVAVLFGLANAAWGGEFSKVGTAGAQFLKIGMGARYVGMGEASVACVDDAYAMYWNPAGLAFQYEDPEVDYRGEASFMHVNWLPQFNFSDLFYDFFAARYYLDEIDGMLGFGLTYLNLGENDEGSPIESAQRGLKRIAETYKKAGAGNNFSYFIEPDKGHVLSDAMWHHVKEVFKKHLKTI